MNLAEILRSEILPRVEKPSRYLGQELNSVHKDPADVEVRLALIFPDLYDLGLGNLGLHILYAILNRLDWCWTERAYAVAGDMESELRSRGLPLFALESKDGLKAFHGLGFTLQSELTYTNILNCLDLSGIPLRTADRGEDDPLTFAGGPSVFNPEPLAPFMDFFVIGDGEDAVVDIARTLRAWRGGTRMDKLRALAALPGVYVPALYPMRTLPDGRIRPPADGPKIVKRVTRELRGDDFPTDYIVPYTEQIHDRISMEVLRGCTQGCRFCQAGMTTRPVRERTVSKIESLIDRTLENTGYEEVSLVSLSTCDYSRSQQLVDMAAEKAEAERISVSLPSLRLDSFSVGLADKVAGLRRSGLTFAPEAASPRLRALINKWIPDEDLIEMSSQAWGRGWSHVKMYFMIGLPTERDDDVEAIADLTLRTLRRGRQIRRDARINTGVSTFVPKPFTPFQWSRQIGIEETNRRQAILMERFQGVGAVRFGRHEPEETFLEGLISRGDRRVADLIEAAWRNGARFDAWREHMDFEAWTRAIEALGFDVEDALRERALDEPLPWDHIDVMIPKQWFVDDWARAVNLEHAPDCRHSQCHRCGVIDVERELCAHMLRNAIDGAKEEGTWTPRRRQVAEVEGEGGDTLSQRATTAPLGARIQAPESKPEAEAPDEMPDPVQRLRVRIGRVGDVRLLGHLEVQNAWIRALRRAKTPMDYTRGFHARPRVTFAIASPVGEASTGDYMDVVVSEQVDVDAWLGALQSRLPDGFLALSAREVPLRGASLQSSAEGFRYTIFVAPDSAAAAVARVEALAVADALPVERMKNIKVRKRRKKVPTTVDIRPSVVRLEASMEADGQARIELEIRRREGMLAKARELVALIDAPPEQIRILRREILLSEDEPLPAEIAFEGAWA